MSKDVYVFAEQRDGEVQKVSLELIGEATRLAKDLGQQVVAVLLGGKGIKSKAQELISYGADTVLVVENDEYLAEYMTEPYTKSFIKVIKDKDPDIVIFGATAIGRDLAPRIAARHHTGLTADCTKLAIDPETKLLFMTRPAFGGNVMATIKCAAYKPQMSTVRPGVMKINAPDTGRKGNVEDFPVDFTPADKTVKIVRVEKEKSKKVDITEAKILVSGGRGIGSADYFKTLQELASAFGKGAEISSSRANVDAGWIEKDRQVGQTGKTVRPALYIACGISGAIQHLAGMEGSDLIIAINKSETAPIFDAADLGVVGDVRAIVPKLTEAVKKHNAQYAK